MTGAGVQIPAALASLAAQLEGLGFVCDAVDASESFGNRVVTCEGPALAVRMVSDRGQWFLDVGRVEWGDWFDPDVWRACIEGAEIPLRPRELAAQAEYVARNVERLADAVEEESEVLSCLRQARAARARRRLSLADE
jgi:hypothetical protein